MDGCISALADQLPLPMIVKRSWPGFVAVKPRPHQQHVEATFDMLLRHVAGVDGA